MSISEVSIDVRANYTLDGKFVSVGNEKQLLLIEQDEYQLLDSFTNYFQIEQLESQFLGKELMNLIFIRDNGNRLESNILLPGYPQINLPVENQVIDHSIQPLDISWEADSTLLHTVNAYGDCLLYRDIDFTVSQGESSLTIPANTLHSSDNQSECDVEVMVYRFASGNIDSAFAAGEFNLEIASSVTIHLTGLTGVTNE